MSPSAETSPGRVARRVLADKHTNALWPAVQHAETPVKPRQDALVTSRTVGHATHAGQKRSRDQVHELATKASDLQTSTFAASPHREGTFQILEDPKSPTTGTQSPTSPTGIMPLEAGATDDRLSSRKQRTASSIQPLQDQLRHKASLLSSVPTDPEARRQFVREKAVLLRRRIQTAMRNVSDNKQLDHKLAEFEARYGRIGGQSSSGAAPGVCEPPPVKVRKLLPAPQLESKLRSRGLELETLSTPTPIGSPDDDLTPTQQRRGCRTSFDLEKLLPISKDHRAAGSYSIPGSSRLGDGHNSENDLGPSTSTQYRQRSLSDENDKRV